MRVAVLGLGYMGSVHAKALQQIPGVELAAVVSRHETRLSGDLTGVGGNIGSGERLDFSNVTKYRGVEAALNDPSIDAVDVCLPTDLHESVAIQAIRLGKHVLVEKPMALTVHSCERMVEEARRFKRILMVAQVLRFFPMYAVLDTALKDPKLGTVRSAVFRRRCAQPAWGAWLDQKARSGGGVFDLLIHDFDMALHLFGSPAAIAASGYEDMPAGIDLISAQLFYRGGLIVEITGGWHPGDFPFSMEYTIVAEGGTLDYNSESRPPRRHLKGHAREEFVLEAVDGYAAELEYFAQCCNSGEDPKRCRPEESAAAVELGLAIIEARKQNGEKRSWVTSRSA
jgi:predicted dehydrogenase